MLSARIIRLARLSAVAMFASIVGGAFTLPAVAQYTEQVRSQLDAASTLMTSAGYRQTHDYEFDSMNDNATERFTLTLDEGMAYKIVVACDNDCSDVDAKLYDSNGNLIDEDVSTDDTPIVDVTPSWTGQFTVEVKMYTCTSEPCFYGIATYGRSAGSSQSTSAIARVDDSSSSSGNQYIEQVRSQLDAASGLLTSRGYSRTHDYELDSMNDDATERFTVTLEGGTSYGFLVVCDNDCSDVDAKLYDENGNLIDEDVSTDDTPIVEVTPSWTGQFTVEVKMYTCTNEPCYYGIGVFGKANTNRGSLVPAPSQQDATMRTAGQRTGKASQQRRPNSKGSVREF